MRFAAITLLMIPSIAHATISTFPVTPAPGEQFVVAVHGIWSDGCVPQLQTVKQSGTTIQIDATADPCSAGCTQAVTPYAFETSSLTVAEPGLYNIELYITTCSKPRTLVETYSLAISATCRFDRSLASSSVEPKAGDRVQFQWCDPSVVPGPDQGVNVSFYRLLMARGTSGPYVALGDFQNLHADVVLTESDAGRLFFFVEAHECDVTIAGCRGDHVVRSNVLSLDLIPTNRPRRHPSSSSP